MPGDRPSDRGTTPSQRGSAPSKTTSTTLPVGAFDPGATSGTIGSQTGTLAEWTNQARLGDIINYENVELGFRDPNSFGRDPEDPRRRVGRLPARKMTVGQAMTELLRLDADDLLKVQMALYEAGAYGDLTPNWGRVDESTRLAFRKLLVEVAAQGGATSVERVLEQMINQGIATREAMHGTYDENGKLVAQPGTGGTLTLQDPHAVADQADEIGRMLLGRQLTEEEELRVVDVLNTRQRQAFEAVPENRREGDPDPEELTAFMNAVGGRESGDDYEATNERTGAHGRFQIMPGNWRAWARRAGLPGGSPRTPENQERVARVIMSDYYREFGNWRDVAIAWYAGPGAWDRLIREPTFFDQAQGGGGEPSITDYADDVYERFLTERDRPGMTGVAEAVSEVTQVNPEATVNRAVRDLDPVGAGARDVAVNMNEFFDLLGGQGG